MSNKDPKQVQLPAADVSTAAQVNTLLGIAGFMTSALGHFLHAPEDIPGPENRLGGETKVALEATLIKTCARLDTIIENPTRWSDEFHKKVEKDYEDFHKEQMAVIQQQREYVASINSPHFRYKPTLVRLISGDFMAFLGDVNSLEFAIKGIGPSPRAALEAFDTAFNGTPLSPELQKWLSERAATLEQTNEQPTESSPVEPIGESNPTSPETKRKKLRRNRDGTGQN